MKKIVVLISGRGSTLQAIIHAIEKGEINTKILAVISSKSDAKGLQIAKIHNIATHIAESTNAREKDEKKIKTIINQLNPEYIILAGYMRIFTPNFIQKYRGQIINMHPSLLPKFKGLHTHQKAIDANETYHGSSTHFVNEKLDEGPLIMQTKIKIQPNDTPKTLAERLLPLEHKLYIKTLKLILNNEIKFKNEQTYYKEKPLDRPIAI